MQNGWIKAIIIIYCLRPAAGCLGGDEEDSISGNDDPTGVVYMQNIPPSMKIENIKDKLSRFGEVKRVYLVAKDTSPKKEHAPTKRRAKRYTQGWIEFGSKERARLAVFQLDLQTIGGKRRTKFFDSVWRLTYLKNFKWNNLTQWLADKNREHRSQVKEWKRLQDQQKQRNKKERKIGGNREKYLKFKSMRKAGHKPGLFPPPKISSHSTADGQNLISMNAPPKLTTAHQNGQELIVD